MLSSSLSLRLGQSSFLTPPGPSAGIVMNSHWILLFLLLVSGDRAFNPPSSASVWVLASNSPSTDSSVLNRDLSCPSTSSSLPHGTKVHDSTDKLNSSSVTTPSTSESQDQMTSSTLSTTPQTESTSGPTEQTTSTVHTSVMTITNSMPLSDSTMTSTGKEFTGTSKTTVLLSLATSAETPRVNQTPPSPTLDKVSDTNTPLPMTATVVTYTSSATTATSEVTALSTATAESQEKDTPSVPPTPTTTSTMSESPATHHSTDTQTPSQPPSLTVSEVSLPPGTAPSPPPSTNIGMGSSMSTNPGETEKSITTPSMALSTSEDTIPSSGTGPPTVPEKSATNTPLPTTTMVVTYTSSATTATSEITALSTDTVESEEKDTASVPPTPTTTPTMSESPATHHSTDTQTPSQPALTVSEVSLPSGTALSPPPSTSTGMGSSMSTNPGETEKSITTPSMTLSTSEDTIPSSGTGPPTVPEKSATNTPLPTTTMVVTKASSAITDTSKTTALSTDTAESEEKDTASVPPTPTTAPTMSASPATHHSTDTQTPSQPAPTGSSIGTGTVQSSEHPTDLVLRSPETTKSSTMSGTNPASPNAGQSSGPRGGACALDEYPASTGGCVCNASYYSHSELFRDIGTLRCRPQDIEVALRSCFLKTHHWVLKEDAFSRCFSINTTEQGLRVQVFHFKKKEGNCGLHVSTNISHVLHSLDVHLKQALPGSSTTGYTVLHFSCAYPLVVNVSQPVSYQEASIPTIHIPSTGETIITLSIFTDSKLSTPLKNSTAPVGMPLYVVLKSTNSDPDRFALVANEVFASTNLSNTRAKATHHFVKESCPVQGRLLQDVGNGASIQVILAFTLSRFLNSDTLYLHAQVTLCDKQASRPCQPSCSGKNPLRRNSPWDSGARTGLEPGSSKWIVFGPLRISVPRASSSRNRAGAWMSILLLMVIGWMLE